MRNTVCLAALAIGLTACTHDAEQEETDTISISGTIVDVNSYGQPIPNFTPADMAKAGIKYTDLLKVKIGNISLDSVPYVTSFNEVAILSPSYVDYNAKGDDYGFGMLNGDFHAYIGGNVGDTCIMTVQKQEGYKDTYLLMKSVYPEGRRPDETAEEYANFRMVTTSNIARGVLYRSSNPLNCAKNPGRYAVADSLAETVGIRTEIDLADTPEQVSAYMKTAGYASQYCPQLFLDGRTMACGMMANSFHSDFKQKMGKAVRFMIANRPPYLIHCNEGKDRCGFVCMVLEALTGATLDELRHDYMTTMQNFYKVEYKDKSYDLRQKLSIDRMIWLLGHEEALEDYTKIQWDNSLQQLPDMDLRSAARKYLMNCGLTEAELQQLHSILTGAE